ncbi:PREP [Cordylochernes scorpioides]|uniref:Prolyl endopeptidase n=1 Tax=Cordylochernes scorpioides TaxID=51811 RepID=A0ABY6LKU3_9ARAC|nr:PREP [Cordylochernes scorpioides]
MLQPDQHLGLPQVRLSQEERLPLLLPPQLRPPEPEMFEMNPMCVGSVLYIQDSLVGEPRPFLDPNTMSKDGCTAITLTRWSKGGSLMAYGISESGSDWFSIKIRDVKTEQDLPDVIPRAKFSDIAWTHDNKGFFYSSYPESCGKTDGTETTGYSNHKLLYHRLGTDHTKDVVCVEFPKYPNWLVTGEVSDCGNLLIISAQEQCKDNLLFYADIRDMTPDSIGLLNSKCLLNKMDSKNEYITNQGNILTILTDKGAPKCRLVNIDIENPFEFFWEELVPEQEVLEWAACVAQDKLVLCYQKNVTNLMVLCDLKTGKEIGQFPLELGTVGEYFGDKELTEIFFTFISFLTPGIIYRCDLAKPGLNLEVYREIKVPGLDTSQLVARQEYYTSKDGTKVPMFLVHKKDLPRESPHPCMLYGYGGFNISLLPTFSPAWLFFVKYLDGIFAMPNLRGGGEFGSNWHDAGRLLNKQNTFDDFIAAMEHLYQQGYSSPSLLTIQGASNGGLLTGTVLNQAPHLVGCAIIRVGVLDMLRFHRYTVGKAWACDYGDPDVKEHFDNLIKFSPLHNIRVPSIGAQYPPALLLTADHDDRVVPLHTLKFVAQLQHTLGSHPAQVA